jgi:hypothetical protein
LSVTYSGKPAGLLLESGLFLHRSMVVRETGRDGNWFSQAFRVKIAPAAEPLNDNQKSIAIIAC